MVVSQHAMHNPSAHPTTQRNITMDWQRARQPDQKDIRRATIVETAKRLLDEPPCDPSLREIAAEAGLSASSIYRYFSSREAVLLHVLGDDMGAWLTDTCDALDALPDGCDGDTIAEVLVRVTADRGRMIHLLGQRAMLLERAAAAEEVRAFRLGLLEVSDRLVPSMQRVLPGLTERDARLLQLHLLTLVSGSAHLRFPSDAAKEAMLHPALAEVTAGFTEHLTAAFRLAIRGLMALRRSGEL